MTRLRLFAGTPAPISTSAAVLSASAVAGVGVPFEYDRDEGSLP
jgi:hypothetical protein